MALDKSKLIPIDDLPMMEEKERSWLKFYLGVESGYFEPETAKFVVSKVV